MIVVVEQNNRRQHEDLLVEMFRLRARVFRDRLNWDVQVTDGMEIDRFDNEGPVYVISTDPTMKRVVGSLRLLPTTGPTLLAEFFSDTLPDAAELVSPSIWECTRFCVDEDLLIQGREGLQFASATLFAGLGEIAVRAGIESILGNFEAPMLRIYRRAGCAVEILGSTRRFGRTVFLGLFEVSAPVLDRVKMKLTALSSQLDGPSVKHPLAA